MKKILTMSTAICLLSLTGCGTPTREYTHFPSGGSEQQYYADKVMCQKIATRYEGATRISPAGDYVDSGMFKDCMKGKGYRFTYTQQ